MKVRLFNNDIELDKKIIVTLDDSLEIFEMFKNEWVDVTYASNWTDFCEQIKKRNPMIVTSLTRALDSSIMELGYDLFVQNGNNLVQFSKLLVGDTEKSLGRQIRETQNWEKMLYSGCFNIEVPKWYEPEL